jgi:hypothetical protein
MPGTGHGVMVTSCGSRLITQFIEQGNVENLRDTCIRSVKRPGFFLTPAGPEPAPAAGAAP